MVNHFEPMKDACPYSGDCNGEPFSCGKCRNNPKNKWRNPSPWIVPFEPYPNRRPYPDVNPYPWTI